MAEMIERRKKKQNKLPYNLGKDVCYISLTQAERARNYGNRIKELRYLLSVRQYANKVIEVTNNIPTAQNVLTVI